MKVINKTYWRIFLPESRRVVLIVEPVHPAISYPVWILIPEQKEKSRKTKSIIFGLVKI